VQFVTFSDFISKTKLNEMNTLNSPFITVYVFFKLAPWQHYCQDVVGSSTIVLSKQAKRQSRD